MSGYREFEKVVKDRFGDTATVTASPHDRPYLVIVETATGKKSAEASLVLDPKAARRLAKALRKAADLYEESSR